MRIISGIYKGRKISSPGDNFTHPMGERERNAVFNSLGDITGFEVLDLFAGTGALGLEALSRGAAHATFVDNSAQAIKVLKENTAFLRKEFYSIVKANALSFSPPTPPDLIFCDPPYSIMNDINLGHILALLSPNTKLVLSAPRSYTPNLNNLHLLSQKSYARCKITILSR